MTGPRRRARPSTISTIGLTGAPAAATPVPAPEPAEPPGEHGEPAREDLDVTTSRPHGPTTSRPHDVTAPRRHEPVAPRGREASTSPAPERPVSYTVRLSLDELDAADELLRALRRSTGRRRLDRSEVIRALLALASSDDRLRARLAKALGAATR